LLASSPVSLLDFSIEGFVAHLRGFERTHLWTLSLFASLLFPAFLFASPSAGQNQSGAQSASPPEQTHRQASPPANSVEQLAPLEEHFRAAASFQVANDAKAAETEYRRVISLAMEKLAASRVPANSPRDASQKIPPAVLAALKELLGNSYHNLGVIYAQREQYAEASRLFADAARWTTSIPDLNRNWGTASFRANDCKMAIVPLQRHSRANPQDIDARQMLAVCYFMTDNFAKAAETFRPLLTNLPDNPSLLYAAGVSLAKTGDSKSAEDLFQRMLSQNPNVAEVRLFMGQARAAQNQDAEAIQEFSRALELNPKLPQAHYSAGKVYLRQGNMEEAEKEFRAELEVNPGDAPSEFRLGHVLLAQHKDDEAIAMLSDVVRQRPDDADALYELGKAFLDKGDPASAVERLENAIHVKPGQPHMYYQLSLAYRRQGRTKEAQAALQQYQTLQRKLFPNKNQPDPEIPK
jgi:tetratricopeptide (TPR) repeat protein